MGTSLPISTCVAGQSDQDQVMVDHPVSVEEEPSSEAPASQDRISPRLLAAQRDERVDARGSPRRDIAGEERDASEHHHRPEERQRVDRFDAFGRTKLRYNSTMGVGMAIPGWYNSPLL